MFEKPPSAPKRFPIQKEIFVEEKLTALRETVEELRDVYGGVPNPIIGATLFGSISQGQAKEYSDIDAWIFVRSNDDYDDSPEDKKFITKQKTFLQKSQTVRNMYTNSDWNWIHRLEERARWILAKKTGTFRFNDMDSRDAMKDLKVIPLSETIIRQLVKELTDPLPLRPRQPLSGFAGVETKRKDNMYPEWMSTIVPMFHLAIGNDIRKYRRAFLEELLKHGAKGEKIWQEVRTQLIMRERGKKGKERPEGIHYPETITDALQAFG